MRFNRIFIISLLLAAVCSSQASPEYSTLEKNNEIGQRFQAITQSSKGLKVDRLRCEYLENPLGIDEIEPRLSWIVTSEARGQKQTAYQIRAASSLEMLLSGNADLWDSGRISSDETV
ncbi:MAG: hypothetical protein KAR47_10230, partial [Planctomycetes bacterium]|nr:hypothetical protein [Planctomycetota bacterium]